MSPGNFSPQALRDIDRAVDDIAESAAGPGFAARFAAAVSDVAARVAHRPLLGHRRPDLLPGRFRFRAVTGFPYLLVHNAEGADRRILRVVHMARDLASMLAELPAPDSAPPLEDIPAED